MATVREGNRGVLLVVDVQVAVVESIWEGARVVKNVARVVERARAAGVAVLWVQQSDEDLPQGSPQWEWAPELVPAPTEARIHKHYNSAFEQTNLEQQLAALAATHITLAGAASNWCLRSTAYAALERGYDLTLVSDAHSTESMELDDGSCVEAWSIIEDLNLAVAWLSYPNRTNSIATAEEASFSA